MVTAHPRQPMRSKLLDNWFIEDVSALISSVQRYSAVVGGLKFTAGTIAVILVLMLIIWPFMMQSTQPLKLTLEPVEVEGVAEIPKMQNPRFHGVDKDNQPFNVTAAEAFQTDNDTVVLDQMQGDITLKDGSWLSLEANQGHIRVSSKLLDMTGDVHLVMDNGYEMFTQSAHVDMEQSMAAGSEPVQVQGAPGLLTAQGFKVEDNGDRIFFHGRVKTTIYPDNEAL